MKRKWIWLLANVPLVFGFVLAKRLANKRPHLVARDIKISELIASPDGKYIIAQLHGSKSQII